MMYKKGSIVPRQLVESVEPKARHLVKFGVDVEVLGKNIKMLSAGHAILIPSTTHVLKKKRQRTVKGLKLVGITVTGFANEEHVEAEWGAVYSEETRKSTMLEF